MFRRNSAYNSTFGKDQGTGQEIVSYKFTSISTINYNDQHMNSRTRNGRTGMHCYPRQIKLGYKAAQDIEYILQQLT